MKCPKCNKRIKALFQQNKHTEESPFKNISIEVKKKILKSLFIDDKNDKGEMKNGER